MRRSFPKNPVGIKFGRLTILSESTRDKRNKRTWECRCDCGKTITVSQSSLLGNNTTSCGCYHAEVMAKIKFKDMTGRRFGKLLVIEFSGYVTSISRTNSPSRRASWKCLCDCGATAVFTGNRLVTGDATSCGRHQVEAVTTHGMSYTKEYSRAQTHKHLAIKRGATPVYISPTALRSHMSSFGDKCYYCGGKYEQIDHIVPLSKGGAHSLDNLAPACAKCNRNKSAKLLGTEWIPPLVFQQAIQSTNIAMPNNLSTAWGLAG